MGLKSFFLGKEGAGSKRATQISDRLQQLQGDLVGRAADEIKRLPTERTASIWAQDKAKRFGDIGDISFNRQLSGLADLQRQAGAGVQRNLARQGIGATSVGLGAQFAAQQPISQQMNQLQASRPLLKAFEQDRMKRQFEAENLSDIQRGREMIGYLTQTAMPLANLPEIKLGRQGGFMKSTIGRALGGAVSKGLAAFGGGALSGLTGGLSAKGLGESFGGGIRGLFSSPQSGLQAGTPQLLPPGQMYS